MLSSKSVENKNNKDNRHESRSVRFHNENCYFSFDSRDWIFRVFSRMVNGDFVMREALQFDYVFVMRTLVVIFLAASFYGISFGII